MSDSTTEAEYKAFSEGGKEAVYLKRLIQELEILPSLKVPISCPDSTIVQNLRDAATPNIADLHLFCHNQSVIKLAKNPVFHAKTKHIESRHHFIRERVLEGDTELKYIHTEENIADLLTKSLPRHKFEKHRKSIGVCSLSDIQAVSLEH